MGVLACGRLDCPNIMCNRLVLGGEAYICNECYSELQEWKGTWKDVRVADVEGKIREFMASSPGTYKHSTDPESVQSEFDRLTGGASLREPE
jgi:hypothetical protein